MTRVALLALVTGCYVEGRPGGNTPIGNQGHAGFDFVAGFGAETQQEHVRAGGGLLVDMRGPGYLAIGASGHAVVTLTGAVDHLGDHILGVAHAGIAFARPWEYADGNDSSHDGALIETFIGVGYGDTYNDPRLHAGHVAIGLTTGFLSPSVGGSYWMLGGSLELSYGWNPWQ